MTKDRRLGRGLAALLSTEEQDLQSAPADSHHTIDVAPRVDSEVHADVATESPADLVRLNVYEIDDNPFQPRRDFHEPEIASLAESLKEHDMLQPVLVRRIGDRYQLISGERRLRAAIQAGWSEVPAQIREADDRLVSELAIVENLQRKDLNPIEKALSFKRYIDEHDCRQDELAARLKIDRSTVANLMRLLELPQGICDAVREDRLSAGHARALLPLGDEPLQNQFCQQILSEGWSVRETERRVQEKVHEEDADQLARLRGKDKKRKRKSQQTVALEQELRMALGTKVEIQQSGKSRGKIVIQFANHAEFDRLKSLLCESQSELRSEAA